MNTTIAQLSTLVPDPENPRAHDKRNLEAIAASLREHGQVEPLLVQASSRMIIAGNGRAEAMRSLGWDTAHVVLLDVNDVQARKLSIQLNRSGELASWDEAVLTKHLQALDGLDDYTVEGMGFSEDELQMLAAAYGDATLPEPEPEPEPADGAQGTAPDPAHADMPNSSVRMVQLYLDNTTAPLFQQAVRKLAAAWNKDNQTDTVLHAVLRAAEAL
jgi:ParB-like chromosome segregation protein Spo0J